MISSKAQIAKYVLCDYVTSNIAWLLFNIGRFYMPTVESGYIELSRFLLSANVLWGQLYIPMIMMAVYYLSGYYNQAFFKSRLHELLLTVVSVMVNTLFYSSQLLSTIYHHYVPRITSCCCCCLPYSLFVSIRDALL